MKRPLFPCFGGGRGGAVEDADGDTAAILRQRRRRGFPFPRRSKKSPATAWPTARRPEREEVGEKLGVPLSSPSCMSALSSSPSRPSSSSSSTSSSLPSTTSCSTSSSSSVMSSAPLFLGAAPPPPAKETPARGGAAPGVFAVLVCLVVMLFCGRALAVLLTSTALYLLPRQPARPGKEEVAAVDDVTSSEHGVRSWEAEEAKRRVVMEGFLLRNRKQ